MSRMPPALVVSIILCSFELNSIRWMTWARSDADSPFSFFAMAAFMFVASRPVLKRIMSVVWAHPYGDVDREVSIMHKTGSVRSV